MAMTREAILANREFRKKEIDVPEWGDTIMIRAFSAIDRGTIEREMSEIANGNLDRYAIIRSKVCVASICDEDGKMLFTEKDIDALGQKDGAVIERIFTEALALNGYTQQDVEDLKKN